MSKNPMPALRLVVLGTALWVTGVLAAHAAAPAGVFSAAFALPLLLATVPMAWGTVRLSRRVGRLAPAELVEGVAVVALPAALLDGIAFTWAPSIYAADASAQRAAAAWLLWFLGASFAIAAAMTRRRAAVS